MTDSDAPLSSILVDVELPDPPPIPPPLVRLLASVHVVLVGWYDVPEQTSPEQARDQFGDELQAALEEVAQTFEAVGATVQTHMVFTPSKLSSLRRLSNEHRCNAVLLPAEMVHLKRILVPLRGIQNAVAITAFVADLLQGDTTDVTLLHVLEDEEAPEVARKRVLDPVAERLEAESIDESLLRRETITARDPGAAVVERSADYDLVVLGETEPSIREILFGTVSETIAQNVNVPVIVVRHLGGEEESAGLSVEGARGASGESA
jgi:nucleotide-binding universal stress UspA family protein